VPGYCAYIAPEQSAALAGALQASGAAVARPEAIDAARIAAGYPVFGVDMTEDTIPLEAGIEHRAISFSKGCYVGQEVIIRVLHRGGGRVAKRLVGLHITGDAPASAAKLLAGDREVGFVTSATPLPRDAIALGYVHRDFTAPGTGLQVDVAGVRASAIVTARPLPSIS
jgi:folate-binding protein YgfZ